MTKSTYVESTLHLDSNFTQHVSPQLTLSSLSFDYLTLKFVESFNSLPMHPFHSINVFIHPASRSLDAPISSSHFPCYPSHLLTFSTPSSIISNTLRPSSPSVSHTILHHIPSNFKSLDSFVCFSKSLHISSITERLIFIWQNIKTIVHTTWGTNDLPLQYSEYWQDIGITYVIFEIKVIKTFEAIVLS